MSQGGPLLPGYLERCPQVGEFHLHHLFVPSWSLPDIAWVHLFDQSEAKWPHLESVSRLHWLCPPCGAERILLFRAHWGKFYFLTMLGIISSSGFRSPEVWCPDNPLCLSVEPLAHPSVAVPAFMFYGSICAEDQQLKILCLVPLSMGSLFTANLVFLWPQLEHYSGLYL